MDFPHPAWRPGLGRHALCRGTASLLGALGLAGFGVAVLPTVAAGASYPASLDCGTLQVNGTDGNSYQLNQFTSGNAVADNGSGWTAKPFGSDGSGAPFNFSSIGSALAGCSDDYGANGTTRTGTVTQLDPNSSTLGFYGTGTTNVFDVTTDQLAGVHRIDFSVPPDSTTLVDVTPSADFSGALDLSALNGNIDFGCPTTAPNSGTNFQWNNGNCGSEPLANENTSTIDVERDNTVWNFSPSLFPASDIITVDGWQGSIVAPDETVNLGSRGPFDGSIFCKRIYGNGHCNHDPFRGRVPRCPHDPYPPPVLAEGTPIAFGGVALAGFGGLVLYRRSNRHARAGRHAA
jgi:choice-of-anchor A domain-containing protein